MAASCTCLRGKRSGLHAKAWPNTSLRSPPSKKLVLNDELKAHGFVRLPARPPPPGASATPVCKRPLGRRRARRRDRCRPPRATARVRGGAARAALAVPGRGCRGPRPACHRAPTRLNYQHPNGAVLDWFDVVVGDRVIPPGRGGEPASGSTSASPGRRAPSIASPGRRPRWWNIRTTRSCTSTRCRPHG